MRVANNVVSATCRVRAVMLDSGSFGGVVRLDGENNGYKFCGICMPFSSRRLKGVQVLRPEDAKFCGTQQELEVNFNGKNSFQDVLAKTVCFNRHPELYSIPLTSMGLNGYRTEAIEMITSLLQGRLRTWTSSMKRAPLVHNVLGFSLLHMNDIQYIYGNIMRASNSGRFWTSTNDHPVTCKLSDRVIGPVPKFISIPMGGQPKNKQTNK